VAQPRWSNGGATSVSGRILPYRMHFAIDLPWDRQPGESSPAFEAFRVYRDAGPRRSLRRVAADVRKSRSLIFRWSSSHGWVARVEAWDFDQAALEQDAHPKVRAARLVRYRRWLESVAAASTAPAEELLRRTEEDPAGWSEFEVRELIDVVHRFARVVPGVIDVERGLLNDLQTHPKDARLVAKERARREVETWSREEQEAYLRRIEEETGFRSA
jgi:hypothetical protein